MGENPDKTQWISGNNWRKSSYFLMDFWKKWENILVKLNGFLEKMGEPFLMKRKYVENAQVHSLTFPADSTIKNHGKNKE